jgi:hypothetical protein
MVHHRHPAPPSPLSMCPSSSTSRLIVRSFSSLAHHSCSSIYFLWELTTNISLSPTANPNDAEHEVPHCRPTPPSPLILVPPPPPHLSLSVPPPPLHIVHAPPFSFCGSSRQIYPLPSLPLTTTLSTRFPIAIPIPPIPRFHDPPPPPCVSLSVPPPPLPIVPAPPSSFHGR